MALAQQTKNGGRYTKKQQEERRIQVYQLHFEKKQSAVKISETLGINRNTINEDIKFWNLQLVDKIGVDNLVEKMNLRILKMEIQRDRLLEYLDECSTEEKIRVERFISDTDNRLVGLFSKLLQGDPLVLAPREKLEEIKESEIREVVRDVVLSDENPHSEEIYTENNLKSQIIQKTQQSLNYAGNMIEKMKRDGLLICEERISKVESDYDYSKRYDLGKFARMRNYLTKEESTLLLEKRAKMRQKIREENEQVEKYFTKYGTDQSKWPQEVKEKFERYEDP